MTAEAKRGVKVWFWSLATVVYCCALNPVRLPGLIFTLLISPFMLLSLATNSDRDEQNEIIFACLDDIVITTRKVLPDRVNPPFIWGRVSQLCTEAELDLAFRRRRGQ